MEADLSTYWFIHQNDLHRETLIISQGGEPFQVASIPNVVGSQGPCYGLWWSKLRC